MTRLVLSLFALPALAVAVAGCTMSSTGKPVITAASVAADLTQGANVLALAGAVYATAPNASASILGDITTAETALTTAAASLTATGATSGDLAANIGLADSALKAAIAADATVDSTGAAKLAAYRTALLASLRIYNTDAPAAGLPVLPVPVA